MDPFDQPHLRKDLRRWRHNTDGSGREITRRALDLRGADHHPAAEERDLFRDAAPTSIGHAAWRLPADLDEPQRARGRGDGPDCLGGAGRGSWTLLSPAAA
ncbi:hypothetical protein Van01_16700 [Micromonospora andamanensis]|uniref:Uncharacterized protein n=1 Tax=Micromonospora andamanensis TaxID=1287068 RepID=A0ABQ4HS30_9ACTN|nr:hypothetical protein Van01_16700 [Micromonospora andamanensis]